jgi:hypothetical protein
MLYNPPRKIINLILNNVGDPLQWTHPLEEFHFKFIKKKTLEKNL